MKATFLVSLDLEAEDLTRLDDISLDIQEKVGEDYIVLEVEAWNRPSLGNGTDPSSTSSIFQA